MKKIVRDVARQTDWHHLPPLADWVVGEAIRIQQIPAPTFQEKRRADYVAQQFEAFGFAQVAVDAQANAYGVCAGLDRTLPAIMVMAHTDTVFAPDTDLTIRREGSLIYGPGLGDNSMGVAGLLGLAKWLRDTNTTPACDIWFVATACEEGLGDLKGVRAAYERLKDSVSLIINLEGLAFGHIYHAGIAVHRLHITATAEGGHSWLHYGRPSAVHGILELGARIVGLHPPQSPRTTFNVGMIEGGQAINAIGTEASLWLDMRSEAQETLDELRDDVYRLIRDLESPDLQFRVAVVGDRPSGQVAVRHPLVQGALAALEQVNVHGTLETGSTDGNIPLYHGCPTVTIGITRGGNAHRLDEYIETVPVHLGLRQFFVLTLAAARHQQADHQRMAGD